MSEFNKEVFLQNLKEVNTVLKQIHICIDNIVKLSDDMAGADSEINEAILQLQQNVITINGTLNEHTEDISNLDNTKANASDVYTKTESDTLLNLKANSSEVYTKTEIDDLLDDKQDTLVSGTNIKTINGASVLGNGDLEVGGSGLDLIWETTNSTGGVENLNIVFDHTQYKGIIIEMRVGSANTTPEQKKISQVIMFNYGTETSSFNTILNYTDINGILWTRDCNLYDGGFHISNGIKYAIATGTKTTFQANALIPQAVYGIK